ncbi:MAG: tRNA (N(6)-L-threonylcarbamoyladenosine(37)-C(2))-methylthiotransferase MtaB [Dehalococcoidia bacterium]
MQDPARRPTAAILTLGCKLNIADSEAMSRRLRSAGWAVTDRANDADAVIVNSCSVTSMADQKSRHLVRLARRLAPDASVALTGCMVETAKPETLDALGADVVSRQPQQLDLADRIAAMRPVAPELIEVLAPRLKTRAFVAAQEGCNDVCAFCIIPRTRGRERSKSIDAVVAEALQREAEGALEIVITGTQLGAYGRDIEDGDSSTPYELLSALLRQTSAPRIRMSSLQPQDITPQLVGLWQDARLCRHFHLALQSGSQGVLERMRRRYSAEEYREAVQRLRAGIPGVAITTDVIVGFPGETEAEFEECCAFCEEMAFAGIHVFPYSNRSGTLAARLPGQVSDATKKERVHHLIELAQRMSRDYRESFVGSEVSVLWETQPEAGAWEGLTDTYVRVRGASADDLHNTLTTARIIGAGDDGLLAEVVP